MPFIALLRWGMHPGTPPGKAHEDGSPSTRLQLAGACLTGALLTCLALLASRGSSLDAAGDLPFFLRLALPAVPVPPSGTHSLVLGASHHKTGTVQMFCLGRVIEAVTGVARLAQVGNVSASDVAAAAAAAGPSDGGSRAGGPSLLLTTLPLAQQCFGRSRDGRAFLCPIQEAPCTADGAPTLGLEGCFLSLPLADVAVWHYVRRPLDVVVSALWYHMQQPAPEPWIDKEFSSRVDIMRSGGVPRDALSGLGLQRKHVRMPYGDLLRTLPEAAAVKLEFWRSAPGLYAMARQHAALARHPTALQLHYEEAQRDFNRTLLRMAGGLYPEHTAAILQGAQECNPATWSASAAAASNHVTAGKHTAADRARLQTALLAEPRIRAHLCALTALLGYEEPRCGVVAARRLLAAA